MSELTDDQLDGLFRKSAEEFKTPFDPAAWQDMKARLDADNHIAPANEVSVVETILRWGLPAVLLLLLVGWVGYKFVLPAGPVSVPLVESELGTTNATKDKDGRPRAYKRPNNGKIANRQSMQALEQVGTYNPPANEPALVTPGRNTVGKPYQRDSFATS